LCPPVLLCCNWHNSQLQHSRTGGHNEPSTTRDQRLHVQLRSSWWWTQWCPKHVERNNVNKILRILKQSTSGWRFYSSYYNVVRNHEPECSFMSVGIHPYKTLRTTECFFMKFIIGRFHEVLSSHLVFHFEWMERFEDHFVWSYMFICGN